MRRKSNSAPSHIQLEDFAEEYQIGYESSMSGEDFLSSGSSSSLPSSLDSGERERLQNDGYSLIPKDEAALLKKGIVDKKGLRSSYSSRADENGWDEARMLRHGVIPRNGQVPSTKPITIAELNSRGFLDSNNRLVYRLPSRCSKASTSSSKSHRIRNSETDVTPTASPASSGASENSNGVLICETGSGADVGTMSYTVMRDGRNYELKTPDGGQIQLEFSMRHTYLVLQ